MLKKIVSTKKSKSILSRLWVHIDTNYRIKLAIICMLMLVSSFFEVVSIGAVIPFLTVLMEPDSFFSYPLVNQYVLPAGIESKNSLIIFITGAFVFAALISGLIRVLLMWMQLRTSFMIGADLAVKIYERTIYQPYLIHIYRNTSEIISANTSKIDRVISHVIYSIMLMISSTIVLLIIIVFLIFIDPLVAAYTFFTFAAIYLTLIFGSKKIIRKSSSQISYQQSKVVKILQESMGGIRDILIASTQAAYISDYRRAEFKLKNSISNIAIIGSAPRYIVESFGIAFIAILAFWLLERRGNFLHTISVLGALALAAQRILPLAQQLFSSWSSIKGSADSLNDVISLLEQKTPLSINSSGKQGEPYQKNIFDDFISLELNNISFKYSSGIDWSLRNFSLKIRRGEKIGIIGVTGSGKSTLLDLIMGLLFPNEGAIEVNGVKLTADNINFWRDKISHVPQSIYLADATIEQNIAFGVPFAEIDKSKVVLAAKRAGLSELISNWQNGYQTIVGERGFRLSGGQRQRIGIARALYKNTSLIIMDEATSSLDTFTENLVMSEVNNLDSEITMIIVAHRLTTLKDCNYIVEIEGGRLKQVLTYKDIHPLSRP